MIFSYAECPPMQRRQNNFPWLFLLALAASASLLIGCGQIEYVLGGEDGWTLETVPIPLDGTSKQGSIGDDEYRYFRYASPEDAEVDRELVSKDGLTIGNALYDWGSSVHFFHHLKSIVIYVGDNEETISGIEEVFGEEFAGN